MPSSQSEGVEEQHAVYISTSLGTHLAVAVYNADTVADLKKKMMLEHLSSFPNIGEIKIDAVKVKRRGCFYFLYDSMFVRTIFKGLENGWYLYVDARTTMGHLSENLLLNRPFSRKELLLGGVHTEGLNMEGHFEGRKSVSDEDLIDVNLVGASSERTKKLNVRKTSKHQKQEDLAVEQTGEGSSRHDGIQTMNSLDLVVKEPNRGGSIGEKLETVLPVQEQSLEADTGVRSGLHDGVNLLLENNRRHLDGNEDGQAEKDNASHVSVETDLVENRSSPTKRKMSTHKKELSKKTVDQNGNHGALSLAESKELGNKETIVDEMTESMALVHEQVSGADACDGNGVKNGLNLLGENGGLSNGDKADGGAKKDVASDLLVTGMVENAPSRKKRKKSTHEKESSRRDIVDPNEVSTHKKESSAKNIVDPNEENGGPSNGDKAEGGAKKDVASDSLVAGMVENAPSRKKRKKSAHERESSRKDIVNPNEESTHKKESSGKNIVDPNEEHGGLSNGEKADGGAKKDVASDSHVAGMVENAPSRKKRKKSTHEKESSRQDIVNPNEESTRKKEPSGKNIIDANEEHVLMHVEGSHSVISLAEPKEPDKKESIIEEMTENIVLVHEEDSIADTGDRSGVQNGPNSFQGGNNVPSNGDKADGEAEKGDITSDLFVAGTVVDGSLIKKSKKSTRKKESSRKKIVHKDEEHKLEHAGGSQGVSSLARPKKHDNEGTSIEEKSENLMLVHDQALQADFADVSGVQNDLKVLQGENNGPLNGDEALRGAKKGDVSRNLIVSGVVEGGSSRKKRKNSSNTEKSSRKRTVDPDEEHKLKHVEGSKGVSSLAGPTDPINKETSTENKSTNVVLHHQASQADASDGSGVQNGLKLLLKENTEQFNGDEANQEAGKGNVTHDLLVSRMVEYRSSPKEKKSTQKKDITRKKPVDSCGKHDMIKKGSGESISASAVSNSDNLLSSNAQSHASDGKHEDSERIKFSDYFSLSKPRHAVAGSENTGDDIGMKENKELNPPKLKESKDPDPSGSGVEVAKNRKKGKHSTLDRFCVAFRNSSKQNVKSTAEGQKRNLLAKPGTIFKDKSSSCSDDSKGSNNSDTATRTTSDDLLLSDYSDGDSCTSMKSRQHENLSQRAGGRGYLKSTLSSDVKDQELTRILQSSSRYKKAKLAVSQSLEPDIDSQPVEFVPDSQANG